MTRTSVHNRVSSHLRDQRLKKESCPLYRHDMKYHNGDKQTYETKIVASEKKLLKLNCLEAIHIENHPDNLLMNEKNERGRGGVVRITATRMS